ncbi:MAG: MATE family efflux transporter, partial [Dorea sp.]
MKKELTHDLTQESVAKTILLFAGPMMVGNLLQQCYNIADTFIVGRFLGSGALAAVGSAYTLMTFLTSVLIGLCMGSGSVFSFYFGKKDSKKMKNSMAASFVFIGIITIMMNVVIFAGIHPILRMLQTPEEVYHMMYEYVFVIFWGVFFVFLYNYYAYLLRAVGNSSVPLWFLMISSMTNIVLDILFVVTFEWGIAGAALATVLAQAFAGMGIVVYVWTKEPSLRFTFSDFRKCSSSVKEVARFSVASSVQQSIMNFGILMIQGLVNSFGTEVMAAFAAAVKIDSFAYMPAQEFSNAYSLFISQNHGAKKRDRVHKGTKTANLMSVGFCLVVSAIVFMTAPH